MKNIFFKIMLILLLFVGGITKTQAVQFDLLVLPTDIFSVCDNYFCFPEVSNIIAEDIIQNLEQYKNINIKTLYQVRQKLNSDYQLKQKTIKVIEAYGEKDKIDFTNLNDLARAFEVKSVLIVDTYAINDKTSLRRNLWDTLEITSAFKITYPFELKTSAVLTDCVNSVVMWSGKYSKNVSDTFGYYNASNQTQALSHLEKIKQYSYDIVSKNISQNVYMRFFPKDVRTFQVKKQSEDAQTKFVPNALEHLSDPHIRKELDTDNNKKFRDFDLEDFVF